MINSTRLQVVFLGLLTYERTSCLKNKTQREQKKSDRSTHLSGLRPAWPPFRNRIAAGSSDRKSVWLLRSGTDSASVSLFGRTCRTLQPEGKAQSSRLGACASVSQNLRPRLREDFFCVSRSYVAEQHGVFGPAVVGAEFLSGASVLRRHQLLGRGLAEDAGLTVFPPRFRELLLEELLAA